MVRLACGFAVFLAACATEPLPPPTATVTSPIAAWTPEILRGRLVARGWVVVECEDRDGACVFERGDEKLQTALLEASPPPTAKELALLPAEKSGAPAGSHVSGVAITTDGPMTLMAWVTSGERSRDLLSGVVGDARAIPADREPWARDRLEAVGWTVQTCDAAEGLLRCFGERDGSESKLLFLASPNGIAGRSTDDSSTAWIDDGTVRLEARVVDADLGAARIRELFE